MIGVPGPLTIPEVNQGVVLLQPWEAKDQVEPLHPSSNKPKLHVSLLSVATGDQELSPTEAVSWQIIPINGADMRWQDPCVLEAQLLSLELSHKIAVGTQVDHHLQCCPSGCYLDLHQKLHVGLHVFTGLLGLRLAA